MSTDSGSEPATASSGSDRPSLSSSVSALLPVPSPSVSTDSVGSKGKASCASGTPSLSSSESTASGMPSPSLSAQSAAQVAPVSAPSHRASPQQADTRGANRQNRFNAASTQLLPALSVPHTGRSPFGLPTLGSPQHHLCPPPWLPAQSDGQVTQFSPSPASHRPLPQLAPLDCAQSAGQLTQSSPISHVPLLLQLAGS